MLNKIEKFFEKIEADSIMNSIRMGLIKVIPIAILGSLVVLLQAFARMVQLNFQSNFIGKFLHILEILNLATFGMVSFYLVIFISISYMELHDDNLGFTYGAPLAAISGFIILNGGLGDSLAMSNLGLRGSFSAIVSAIIASALYCKLCRVFKNKTLYTEGADSNFNHILSCLIPMGIILSIFSAVSFIINYLFGVSSLQELFGNGMNLLFDNMGNTLLSSFLYVFLSSLLWLCGIHGNNVLLNVQSRLFSNGVETNIANILDGGIATELFTGTFFNVFVYIGGCGSLLCLLFAMLLFSKRGNNHYLAKAALLPTLFNVNELLIFGLPVVLNPYMVIPFIATPVIFMLTSAAAMYLGLVPYTVHAVEWTTPVLFSGYLATESISGSILQLINVGIGISIYRPFLKLYDKSQLKKAREKLNILVELYQQSEQSNQDIALMETKGLLGSTAKNIGTDLRKSLENKDINIFYQPQFDEKLECIGTEALLRWKHPLYGMIYPPLIIKLADEEGILYDLEQYIFESVAIRIQQFEKNSLKKLKFSINVTVKTLMQPSFELFLNNLRQDYSLKKEVVCIEVTEQMALNFDENMENRLKRIRQMGYMLAIDDFSMGKTSLKYLQSNQFDVVKLDGNLVKNLNSSGHSREIISSIVFLSQSLGFDVLAEYVETEENRRTLEDIGCIQYQGYLFSKAISYDEFCDLLK